MDILLNISVLFLTSIAAYAIFDSAKKTREKRLHRGERFIEQVQDELSGLLKTETDGNSLPESRMSNEELSKAMLDLLVDGFGFRKSRANNMARLFRVHGTPDMVVSSDPINRSLVVCYRRSSPAFSKRKVFLSSLTSEPSFWGEQWICEARKDLAHSYLFSPSITAEDARSPVAQGIGLYLMRIYAAELIRKHSHAVSQIPVAHYYDFIWGFDEPGDTSLLESLFPMARKKLELEWEGREPEKLDHLVVEKND